MSQNFYDKVAQKFGGYGYGSGRKPQYKSEYPAGDPEKVFKEKLLGLSLKDKTALQKYVKKFSTDKGIMLSRHRLVMVVQKAAEAVKVQ